MLSALAAVQNYFFTVPIPILFASKGTGNPELFLFIGKKFRRFFLFLSQIHFQPLMLLS